MSGKNRLFKSGKTIRLRWDFCWSRISAGFGKSAGFWPEPEPKSGTALDTDTFMSAFIVILFSLYLPDEAFGCNHHVWCFTSQPQVMRLIRLVL